MSSLLAHSIQPGLIGCDAQVFYEERLPPSELSHLVDRLYVLQTGHDSQVFPVVADGCADLLFDCAGQRAPLVSLSLSQALPSVLPANLCMVGARLRPGGIGRLLDVPPQQLNGQVLSLQSLPLKRRWKMQARQTEPDTLLEQLCERLEAVVRTNPQQALIDASLQHLATYTEAETARALDVSERHLRRLFLQQVGLPPKRYQRIRRFQQALKLLAQQPAHSLAALAAENGYFDQAHLAHEWKALSGHAPGFWRGRFLQEARLANA